MKRTIRGIRDKIPGGFVLGRLPAARGNGPVQLIKFTPNASNSINSAVPSTPSNIAVEFFAGGLMLADEVIGMIVAPTIFELPAGLAGSYAKAITASTGAIVLTIRKATGAGLGSSIGTITFTNDDDGVFVFTANISFARGDKLLVTCPNPANATLANTTILLLGTI